MSRKTRIKLLRNKRNVGESTIVMIYFCGTLAVWKQGIVGVIIELIFRSFRSTIIIIVVHKKIVLDNMCCRLDHNYPEKYIYLSEQRFRDTFLYNTFTAFSPLSHLSPSQLVRWQYSLGSWSCRHPLMSSVLKPGARAASPDDGIWHDGWKTKP